MSKSGAGIKELDVAVEDATTQRKDAHKEFVETTSMNNGALQLLDVAKNRLNKSPRGGGASRAGKP